MAEQYRFIGAAVLFSLWILFLVILAVRSSAPPDQLPGGFWRPPQEGPGEPFLATLFGSGSPRCGSVG